MPAETPEEGHDGSPVQATAERSRRSSGWPETVTAPAATAARAWSNVRTLLTSGHLADTSRMPRTVLRRGEGFLVQRYEPLPGVDPLPGAAPVLVLVSDIAGRVALHSGELPVGIVTAFIGAPVLIALVRRRKASGL